MNTHPDSPAYWIHDHKAAVVIALIIFVPIFLAVVEWRFGDAVPMLIFFGTAAFVIFVVPKAPGSPIACMAHYNDPCTGKTSWIFGLCFLLPLCLCQLYKEIRGDKRGSKGGRLP